MWISFLSYKRNPNLIILISKCFGLEPFELVLDHEVIQCDISLTRSNADICSETRRMEVLVKLENESLIEVNTVEVLEGDELFDLVASRVECVILGQTSHKQSQ